MRPDTLPTLLFALTASTLAGACQEPFGANRQDLVGDRIAAMQAVSTSDGSWSTRLALVQGGQTWSDEAPAIQWGWSDTVEGASAATLTSVGPSNRVTKGPDDGPVLVAHVTFPSGASRLAALDTSALVAPALDAPTLDAPLAVPLDIHTATPDDLALEQRLTLEGSPISAVDPGGTLRWTTPPTAETRIRWMATAGTFLELAPHQTDWFAAEVLLDELEVEAVEDLEPGIVTFMALLLDERGGTAWSLTDTVVGPPLSNALRLDGRYVSVPAGTEPGQYNATLAPSDWPSGLALTGLSVPDSTIDPSTPPCAEGHDGSVMDWLLEAQCTRDELLGAVVLVELTP